MLKNLFKKALASVAAVIMAVTIMGGVASSTVYAADTTISNTNKTTVGVANGTGSVTAEMSPASSDGASIKIDIPRTSDSKAGTQDNTNYEYKIYKVFDATQSGTGESGIISYKLRSNHDAVPSVSGEGNKFVTDTAGNVYFGTVVSTDPSDSSYIKVGTSTWVNPVTGELSATDLSAVTSAINSYVTNADLIADISVASTYDDVTISGLAYGYYYITTSTGALVALNSTTTTGEVGDKNTVPSVNKTITNVKEATTDETDTGGSISTDNKKAIAEVGSTVYFQSVITVGKGPKSYVFHDEMTKGLTLNTTSIVVKKSDATLTAGNDKDYVLTTTAASGDDGDSFTIDFTDTYEATLKENDTITVTYTAIVNNNAVQTNPETNTSYVEYGENHKTTESTVEVKNAKIEVTKNFQSSGDNNLTSGNYLVAGFVLKNKAGAYYKYTAKDSVSSGNPANDSVSWYTLKNGETLADAIKNGSVTEYKTTKDNNVLTFYGLQDDEYTLIESTTPAGYNTAADQTITVKAVTEENAFEGTKKGDNLYQGTDVRNMKGSVLPSTGGIGTTIFYIVGGVLIAGAAVLLIFRRRRRA